MRRILFAVLAVTILLFYPSSNLIAGSPASDERPYIITPHDHTQIWPNWDFGLAGIDEDDDDKGDADDLAGMRGKDRFTGASVFDPGKDFGAVVAIRAYWMFFIIHMLR